MTKNIYSIFDTITGVFSNPFYSVNTQSALRDVLNAVNDVNSQLHKNPSDFVLFDLGFFDDSSGKFSSYEPIHVCNLFQLSMKNNQTEETNNV